MATMRVRAPNQLEVYPVLERKGFVWDFYTQDPHVSVFQVLSYRHT